MPSRWAETMNARQSAGQCRLCANPQVPGRALCEVHLVKERERRKAKYYARKEKRQCVQGGCPRKAFGTSIRCRKCMLEYRTYSTEWQRQNRSKKRKDETKQPSRPTATPPN